MNKLQALLLIALVLLVSEFQIVSGLQCYLFESSKPGYRTLTCAANEPYCVTLFSNSTTSAQVYSIGSCALLFDCDKFKNQHQRDHQRSCVECFTDLCNTPPKNIAAPNTIVASKAASKAASKVGVGLTVNPKIAAFAAVAAVATLW